MRRAILSVSDKTGLIDLARFLTARQVEILSTGGTAKHLADAGIPVTPISEYTGAPEILGGRVKTLHPRVFGGILYDRSNPSHRDDMERSSYGRIDLVVVNLYPFEATVAKEGVTLAEAIENIDVGGPSMLRAAAKNHRDVVVLCDPKQYAEFMDEMNRGEISAEFRARCALEVFRKTSAYDGAISRYLGGSDRIDLALTKVQDLRYGENPQQNAAFYGLSGSSPFRQLQGKELSYNNILDLDAAQKLAFAFRETAVTIIKHTNPCGTATGATIAGAFGRAVEADSVSAFGGIVGANREFDAGAAEAVGSLFLEVIVAPSFSSDAIEILSRKKNLRLIEAQPQTQSFELKSAAGGVLLQSPDRIAPRDGWRVVTKRQVSDEEMRALEFAWIVCAHVKSNAIVLARDGQSVGIGAGQMSRVDSAKIAIMKSMLPTQGCVAASDAFFPFRDGLDILAGAGVTAVVQPGGSVRDDEVTAAADEHGLAMVFTGERHFKH